MSPTLFHSGTRDFLDYWSALSVSGAIPARAAFDPMMIGRAVPRLFSADHIGRVTRLRLAGDWVETLHDQRLARQLWQSVWHRSSHDQMADTVQHCLAQGRPMILAARDTAQSLDLEIALLPFRDRQGRATRLIGHYQPMQDTITPPAPVGLLVSTDVIEARAAARSYLSLATIDGRRVA